MKDRVEQFLLGDKLNYKRIYIIFMSYGQAE